MSIHPVQSSPALYQTETASPKASAPAQSRTTATPRDTVTISAAAKTKPASVSQDTNHDPDAE
jgi:hypothetical protein